MGNYTTLFTCKGKPICTFCGNADDIYAAQDNAEWAITVKYPNVKWDKAETWNTLQYISEELELRGYRYETTK